MTNEKEVTEKVARIIDQAVGDKKSRRPPHISPLPSEDGSLSFDLEPGGLRSLSSPHRRDAAFLGLHRDDIVSP